ncbi:hypothetical protein Tco_0717390 [Tanacetum coccineum]
MQLSESFPLSLGALVFVPLGEEDLNYALLYKSDSNGRWRSCSGNKFLLLFTLEWLGSLIKVFSKIIVFTDVSDLTILKSKLEFQSISVSETQNLGFDDTFGNTTVVNDDNHISKPPSAIHHLHGEPLSIRDSLTREPAHSHISIDSQQVAMGQGSRINEDCVNESTSSEIEHSSKHKELCLHRFDRFPVNKGAVPFALLYTSIHNR